MDKIAPINVTSKVGDKDTNTVSNLALLSNDEGDAADLSAANCSFEIVRGDTMMFCMGADLEDVEPILPVASRTSPLDDVVVQPQKSEFEIHDDATHESRNIIPVANVENCDNTWNDIDGESLNSIVTSFYASTTNLSRELRIEDLDDDGDKLHGLDNNYSSLHIYNDEEYSEEGSVSFLDTSADLAEAARRFNIHHHVQFGKGRWKLDLDEVDVDNFFVEDETQSIGKNDCTIDGSISTNDIRTLLQSCEGNGEKEMISAQPNNSRDRILGTKNVPKGEQKPTPPRLRNVMTREDINEITRFQIPERSNHFEDKKHGISPNTKQSKTTPSKPSRFAVASTSNSLFHAIPIDERPNPISLNQQKNYICSSPRRDMVNIQRLTNPGPFIPKASPLSPSCHNVVLPSKDVSFASSISLQMSQSKKCDREKNESLSSRPNSTDSIIIHNDGNEDQDPFFSPEADVGSDVEDQMPIQPIERNPPTLRPQKVIEALDADFIFDDDGKDSFFDDENDGDGESQGFLTLKIPTSDSANSSFHTRLNADVSVSSIRSDLSQNQTDDHEIDQDRGIDEETFEDLEFPESMDDLKLVTFNDDIDETRSVTSEVIKENELMEDNHDDEFGDITCNSIELKLRAMGEMEDQIGMEDELEIPDTLEFSEILFQQGHRSASISHQEPSINALSSSDSVSPQPLDSVSQDHGDFEDFPSEPIVNTDIFGDGTELDMIDDLPLSLDKETSYTKQAEFGYDPGDIDVIRGPLASVLCDIDTESEELDLVDDLPNTIIPQKGITQKPRLPNMSFLYRKNKTCQSDRATKPPVAPITKNLDKTSINLPMKSSMSHRRTSVANKLKLITNMNFTSEEKVVNGMKYNPDAGKWEGNNGALNAFRPPQPVAHARKRSQRLSSIASCSSTGSNRSRKPTIRPALIQQKSTPSYTQEFGNMRFNSISLTWEAKESIESKEEDVMAGFDGIELLPVDNSNEDKENQEMKLLHSEKTLNMLPELENSAARFKQDLQPWFQIIQYSGYPLASSSGEKILWHNDWEGRRRTLQQQWTSLPCFDDDTSH